MKNSPGKRPPKSVAVSSLLEIVDATPVSGSLHQSPVVPLLHVQDVGVGISVSGASRATCARSLYEALLRKMFASRSPQQDPVRPLVQDHCLRFSCARCLCRDLCRSL